MRPVDASWPTNQPFGSYATGGVVANEFGTEVQQLVYQYGNYQPYGHAGMDIACPVGTPVHAIAAGTVLWADWGTNLPGDESDAGYRHRWYLYKTFPGIVTVIQHDGWISVYAHLSDAPLNPGDRVIEGQQIALSGNTRSPGVSLGAHLHVEALTDLTFSTGNGVIYGRTNPEPYFSTITPQSADIPATPQPEDDMFTDQDRAMLAQALDDGHRARQVLDAIEASDTRAKVDTIATKTANIPFDLLTGQFRTKAGTPIGVAAALGELLARPVSAGAVDVEALAASLAAKLNAAQAEAFMAAFRTQINK